jgi:hypothetical protein
MALIRVFIVFDSVSENLDDADKKGIMIMTRNPYDNKTS